MKLSEDSTLPGLKPRFSIRPSPSSSYMAEFCITRVTGERPHEQSAQRPLLESHVKQKALAEILPPMKQASISMCCSNSESGFDSTQHLRHILKVVHIVPGFLHAKSDRADDKGTFVELVLRRHFQSFPHHSASLPSKNLLEAIFATSANLKLRIDKK